MMENEPMHVRSRGRLYTSERQRRAIETTDRKYGRGTTVVVAVMSVDRSPSWGTYKQGASFHDTLGYYGEVTIPDPVRERLGLDVDDAVRVSMRSD